MFCKINGKMVFLCLLQDFFINDLNKLAVNFNSLDLLVGNPSDVR